MKSKADRIGILIGRTEVNNMEEKLFDVVVINDKIVTTREHREDKDGEHTTGVFRTSRDAKINAHKLERHFHLEYR